MKLIAIDDGHGMETPGKRTPMFPGTNKFMHENEFNNAVAQILKVNLERCGFHTMMVAPTDADTPLRTRVDTADKAKADLFISIHANALNGVWGNQQGVCTYHYPGSKNGLKAAMAIHKHMIKNTIQKDRKVQTADFYVLRESDMPSVLVECAFMDNLREAELLMSESFRKECAKEICRGICEYFSVPYYHKEFITYILEFDPMSLKAAAIKGKSGDIAKKYKNFVNANFFGKAIIGWLISEGKVISRRDEYKTWKGNPKGSLIVYKNGDVECGLKLDSDIAPIADKIWFMCQGFNLFPFDLKKEGFLDASIARSCVRVAIGYNKTTNRVILAVRPASDAKRAILTLKNLGCDSGICLDSGSSCNLFVEGQALFKTDSTLTNILTW